MLDHPIWIRWLEFKSGHGNANTNQSKIVCDGVDKIIGKIWVSEINLFILKKITNTPKFNMYFFEVYLKSNVCDFILIEIFWII